MGSARLELAGAVFRVPGGCLTVGTRAVEGPGLLGVVGRTGSGKSNLLRCLAGLHPLAAGVFHARLAPDRRRLVLQRPEWQLYGATVSDVVGAGGEEALRRLGVAHLERARPYQLSTGERRRVMLAALLRADAPLVLLDEPTAGVDAEGQATAARVIAELADTRLVVVATHDWPWLVSQVPRAWWMEDLAVAGDGPPAELAARLTAGPELFDLVQELKRRRLPGESWWSAERLAAEIVPR